MAIGLVRFLASLAFILCTPVVVVASNLRSASLDPAVYEAGQAKLGIAGAMGVSQDQVRAATAAIVEYLQSAPDSLPGLLANHGVAPTFFSQRDMLHFVDVHRLVQMVFQAQLISAVLAGVSLIAIVLLYRERRDEKVAFRILLGCGLTVLLLVIIGLVSFTNFDTVFLQFHFIAFTNDYWILDPRVDRLIVMMPPQFFYDMMLQASLLALAEAFGVAAIAAAYLFVKRRSGRRGAIGYR